MSFKYKEEKKQNVSRKPEFHISSNLDILGEIRKIWLEIRNMREDFYRESTRIWEEIKSLREETTKIWKEIEKLREDSREEFRKIWGEIKNIREEIKKIWEEIRSIKEDTRRVWMEIKNIWEEIRGIRRTLEGITITIEEEAREVIKYKLREKLGVDIELSDLITDEFEVNIFGVSNEYCVIGEATTRAESRVVEELERKINKLLVTKPELRVKKVIKVIYSLKPTDEAVELAREKNIWLLKLDKEYTSLNID